MSVIVVGRGMTGAILALAISYLTNGKLPVKIIKSVIPRDRTNPSSDERAIALAEGTCQQLARINLWYNALADYSTSITNVQVSDHGHAGFVTIDATEYGVAALGNVIEMHKIGNRLYQLLRKAYGVTLYCPEKINQIERRHDKVIVTMDNGKQLYSKLLVAADGSYSHIASACGIQYYSESYKQIAVITNVNTQIAHNGRAYECFTQHGPLALLPISNGRSSLVWCHPLQAKTYIESWSDVIFLAKLQKTFGWRLGRFTHVGQRYYYPLVLKRAHQIYAHRLVLVGDAAQTLHPIAGQGLNLGIRDVMSLAETLAKAHNEQHDVGSFAILQSYGERRTIDRNATICITDGLVRLFSNNYLPLVIGRNLGMIMMNNFPKLRNVLVERLMGWVVR